MILKCPDAKESVYTESLESCIIAPFISLQTSLQSKRLPLPHLLFRVTPIPITVSVRPWHVCSLSLSSTLSNHTQAISAITDPHKRCLTLRKWQRSSKALRLWIKPGVFFFFSFDHSAFLLSSVSCCGIDSEKSSRRETFLSSKIDAYSYFLRHILFLGFRRGAGRS